MKRAYFRARLILALTRRASPTRRLVRQLLRDRPPTRRSKALTPRHRSSSARVLCSRLYSIRTPRTCQRNFKPTLKSSDLSVRHQRTRMALSTHPIRAFSKMSWSLIVSLD